MKLRIIIIIVSSSSSIYLKPYNCVQMNNCYLKEISTWKHNH